MTPPQAQPQPTLFWALFGLRGRISRRTFWMIQAALICVNSVLFAQLMGKEQASFHGLAYEVAPFIGVLTLASNIASVVKRLHDFGLSGFVAIALLIPAIIVATTNVYSGLLALINLAVTVWIGIRPSDPNANKYGSAPDRPR